RGWTMRGWEGLYGRPGVGCGRVPARCEQQDAGDHKGPPNPTSAALAPTDVEGLVLRLMPIVGDRKGRPYPTRASWADSYRVGAHLPALAVALVASPCPASLRFKSYGFAVAG